ncbi:MAG: phospholipase D family protein [Chloroflexota bacterium]
MAKFLETTGISHHLQQLIDQANETLILISPYLKVNERLRYSLEDRDRMKIDIRIVYGKSELQPEQINWLRELKFVRTSFCGNLHAKCYLNESEAIITSMNLYEYSQVNNEEMGIYVTKDSDAQLYDDIYQSARRLIRISDEVRLSAEKVDPQEKQIIEAEIGIPDNEGFCLRCGISIKLNPQAPYCYEHYKSWKRYENRDYQENYCHICGKEYSTSMARPVCLDCYKTHKRLFFAKF